MYIYIYICMADMVPVYAREIRIVAVGALLWGEVILGAGGGGGKCWNKDL